MCRQVAKALNDYENHRSDTAYEDNLIAKTFIFSFVNAYASFFYTAFIRRVQANEPGAAQPPPADSRPRLFDCSEANCMRDLQTQLSTVFLTRVLISNLQAVLVPYYFWVRQRRGREEKERRKKRQQDAEAERRRSDAAGEPPLVELTPRRGSRLVAGERKDEDAAAAAVESGGFDEDAAVDKAEADPQGELSPVEAQFRLDEYHVLLGPFRDYAELVVILGFAILFVGAFPLAPLMALVNAYVQIRVDAWRIAIRSRRPWPNGAEDIGTWNAILDAISYLAVFINGLIISYTGDFLVNRTNPTRFATFIVYVHGIFFFKYVIDILIDDSPADVRLQIERQTFVESKLIRKIPDPGLEVFGDLATAKSAVDENDDVVADLPDLTIYDEDDDHYYKDVPGWN